MGEGPFVASPVAVDLSLCPDNPRHGTVEPARVMPVQDYRAALEATRDEWILEQW
jgi:hypothetical protein